MGSLTSISYTPGKIEQCYLQKDQSTWVKKARDSAMAAMFCALLSAFLPFSWGRFFRENQTLVRRFFVGMSTSLKIMIGVR